VREWLHSIAAVLPRSQVSTRAAGTGSVGAISGSKASTDPRRLSELVAAGVALGITAPELTAARDLLASAEEWATQASAVLAAASSDASDTSGGGGSHTDRLAVLRRLLDAGRALPLRLPLLADVSDAFDRLSWRDRAEGVAARVRAAVAAAGAEEDNGGPDALCEALISGVAAAVDAALTDGGEASDDIVGGGGVSRGDADAEADEEEDAAEGEESADDEVPGTLSGRAASSAVGRPPSAAAAIGIAALLARDPRPRLRDVQTLLRQAPSSSIPSEDPLLRQLRTWQAECDAAAGGADAGKATTSSPMTVADVSHA
jgi:hypothetical protein